MKSQRKADRSHEFHLVIGKILKEMMPADSQDFELILDSACEHHLGNESRIIPLYLSGSETRTEREISDVDAIVIDKSNKSNSRISIIIEIEESGIKPIKVCGKFLTSALADELKIKDAKPISLVQSKPISFIQILRLTDDMKKERSKLRSKMVLIGDRLSQLAASEPFNIVRYDLLIGDEEDFRFGEAGVLLRNAIKSGLRPI